MCELDSVTFDDVLSLGVPLCVRVYVQGNPDAGKSFFVHTVSKINILLFTQRQVMSKVAPTGCSAAIIFGRMYCQALSTPIGKKLTNLLSELNKQQQKCRIL